MLIIIIIIITIIILPFVPAAAKSKCMGQENKWNDQHCQNVLVFEQILQSSTIRNNGLIEKCFVGYFLALVSGTFFYHPL